MTTPGGDENLIEIPVTVTPAGDATQIGRALGRETYEALAQAIRGEPIQLPGINGEQMLASARRVAEELKAAMRSGFVQSGPGGLFLPPGAGQQRVLPAAGGAGEQVSQLDREVGELGQAAGGTSKQLAEARAALQEMGASLSEMRAAASGGAGGAGITRRGLAGQADVPGGPGNPFVRGFLGKGGLAQTATEGSEFLGSIARYQLAYAVIFNSANAFKDLISQEKESQRATLELSHAFEATGSSVTEANRQAAAYADTLGRIASAAGQAPSVGTQAGAAGVFAFGDQIRSGGATQQQVATTSAQTAMRAQILTGEQLEQVQHELIASTLAFNLGTEGQARVLDAATEAYHRYGGSIASVLQALPNVAEASQAAGFSLEQTANLVALIGSRTGQNATAAGTQLTRIIEQVQSPAVQSLLRGAGVTLGQSPEAELQQLSSIFPTLGTARQNQLARGITGARGVNALQAILGAGPEAFSTTPNSGIAEREALQQLDTFQGELKQIGGEAKQVGQDLVDSGILNILGEVVLGVKDLVGTLDLVLKPLDEFNRATHGIAITVAEDIAALLLLNKVLGAQRNVAAEAAVAGGTAEATTALGPLARARGAVRSGGSALLGGVQRFLPEILAAGVVAGSTYNAYRGDAAARRTGRSAEDAFATAQTPADLQNAASQLGTAAADLQHATRLTFGGAVANLFGVTDVGRTASQAADDRAAAAIAQHMATVIAQENARGRGGLIQRTGDISQDLTQALTSLMGTGATPAAQNAAILQLLSGRGARTGVAGTNATAQSLAGAVGSQWGVNPQDVLNTVINRVGHTAMGGDLSRKGAEEVARQTAAAIEKQQLAQIEALANQGLMSDADYSKAVAAIKANAQQVIQDIMQQYQSIAQEAGGKGALSSDTLQDLLYGKVSDPKTGARSGQGLGQLFQQQQGLANPLDPNSLPNILANQADTLRNLVQQYQSAGLDKKDPADYKALVAMEQQAVAQSTNAAVQNLQASQAVIEATFLPDDQEGAIQQKIKDTQAQIAAAGANRVLRQQLQAQLNTLLGQQVAAQVQAAGTNYFFGGRGTAITRDFTDPAEQIRAQMASAQAQLRIDRSGVTKTVTSTRKIDNTASIKRVGDEIAAAQANLAGYQDSYNKLSDQINSEDAIRPGQVQNLQRLRGNIDEQKKAIADYEKELSALQATQGTSVTSSNVVQLQKASRDKLNKDTLAYQQLVVQLHEALLDQQHVYAELHIDMTDPAAVAREALRQARRQQAYDRSRGADAGTLNADEVNRRNAAAQAQAAAFQQRFTDVQNAHSLLQISDQAYMNYLQAQDHSLRMQLAGMKVGTQGYRQAFDELTQIDQAIMAANQSLMGQFNLGNIRVPTVYQVRESLANQRAGLGPAPGGGIAQTQNIQITINDTTGAQVARAVLADVLGPQTITRTPTVPSKVG